MAQFSFVVRIAAVAMVGVTVSGCMADFVAPLAVTAHRYPNLRLARTATAQPQPDLAASAEPADDQPGARPAARRHVARRARPPESLRSDQASLEMVRQSRADIAAAQALRSRLSDDPGHLSQATTLIR